MQQQIQEMKADVFVRLTTVSLAHVFSAGCSVFGGERVLPSKANAENVHLHQLKTTEPELPQLR